MWALAHALAALTVTSVASCPSTLNRSHRRTSIRLPTPRHTHRYPSPPPQSKQARVTSRSAWSKNTKPDGETGNYTLGRPTFDHRGREIRSEIWQPDREEEYIALYGHLNHEHPSRRPRARTISSSPEAQPRSGRARVRTGSLSASPFEHPQLRHPCLAETPSTSRKHEHRRKPRRPAGVIRRDSGYGSDDADEDSGNEGERRFPIIFSFLACFVSSFHLDWTPVCDFYPRVEVSHHVGSP